MIPRNKTLLLDGQNTQDHGLALHWTRDMPRASQHFFTRQAPCGAAAVSLPARARHCMIMRTHAAHRTQLLKSFSTICGGHQVQEVKNSTSTKLCGSPVAANEAPPVTSTWARDMADGGRVAWAVRRRTSHAKPLPKTTYLPGSKLAVAVQSCHTGIDHIR